MDMWLSVGVTEGLLVLLGVIRLAYLVGRMANHLSELDRRISGIEHRLFYDGGDDPDGG